MSDTQRPTWTTDDITTVADTIRDYLRSEAPEVAAHMFNSDVEEIAIRVWPIIEARTQERITNLLAQAAAGRREYAVNAPESSALVLEDEARQLETVARLVGGDMSAMTAWLPSWRWTPQMCEDIRTPTKDN